MSYQLRHKDFGLYQGSLLGLGFWHLMSNMPELGIFKFKTEKDILGYLEGLTTSVCDAPMKRKELIIENFDIEFNKKLVGSTDKIAKFSLYLQKWIEEVTDGKANV